MAKLKRKNGINVKVEPLLSNSGADGTSRTEQVLGKNRNLLIRIEQNSKTYTAEQCFLS